MRILTMRILTVCFAAFAFALVAGPVGAAQCQNNIPPTNPDSVYEIHGDGTVTDTRTGLMWKRCSEGQTWDGNTNTCTGNASDYTWAEALNHALALTDAGHDDWRLPNRNELLSLVEYCTFNPAINADVFPNMPSYPYFWSASPSAYSSSSAWYVYFSDGHSYYEARDSNFRVRAVRGGQ